MEGEKIVTRKEEVFDSEKYGAVTFKNIEFGTARFCLGIKKFRVISDGTLSLNLVNSAKWGHELHLQIFENGEKTKLQRRNNSKWTRAEFYIPIQKLGDLINCLQEFKQKV